MSQLYIEHRAMPPKPPTTLAADIARHMQMRQFLGSIVVICEHPLSILSAVRKQWLKGARQLQTMRASTLNAEEILRLTHAIMHMQNMSFVAKVPLDSPHAAAYFLTPDQAEAVPYSCYSIYITTPIERKVFTKMRRKLPDSTLVIGYDQTLTAAQQRTMLPKRQLEDNLMTDWEHVRSFLLRCEVDPERLVVGGNLQFGAIDDALDSLLGHSNDFLRFTASFQRLMNLAQPLTIFPAEQQRMFEVIIRLAHRVQSLSPGTFNSYLLKTFGDSGAGTFFLRDVGSQTYGTIFTERSLYDYRLVCRTTDWP